MAVDYKICRRCREKEMPHIYGPDASGDATNNLEGAIGWWCPRKGGHIYHDDASPEECPYVLEHIMSTQNGDMTDRKPRSFLGRKG